MIHNISFLYNRYSKGPEDKRLCQCHGCEYSLLYSFMYELNFNKKNSDPKRCLNLKFFFQRDRDSVYPMETSPRGLMLIINNKDFPTFREGAKERRGTNIDAGKLQGMFNYYGFDVIRRDNLKAEVSWCFVNVLFYVIAYFKAEQIQGTFNISSTHRT